MRTGVIVDLSPSDRECLQAIVDNRNTAQKHVWRTRIVLCTADGLGTVEIMRTAGVSKTAVWRWQARFMEEGVEGLLCDKTRPPGIARLADEVAERVVKLTLSPPPGETTHWTGRLMAKAAAVSLTSVQRIWRAHGLAPHRLRTFKLSNDPRFAEKVRDIVGLYVEPPARAVVLSVLACRSALPKPRRIGPTHRWGSPGAACGASSWSSPTPTRASRPPSPRACPRA
jgi:transposase